MRSVQKLVRYHCHVSLRRYYYYWTLMFSEISTEVLAKYYSSNTVMSNLLWDHPVYWYVFNILSVVLSPCTFVEIPCRFSSVFSAQSSFVTFVFTITSHQYLGSLVDKQELHWNYTGLFYFFSYYIQTRIRSVERSICPIATRYVILCSDVTDIIVS